MELMKGKLPPPKPAPRLTAKEKDEDDTLALRDLVEAWAHTNEAKAASRPSGFWQGSSALWLHDCSTNAAVSGSLRGLTSNLAARRLKAVSTLPGSRVEHFRTARGSVFRIRIETEAC